MCTDNAKVGLTYQDKRKGSNGYKHRCPVDLVPLHRRRPTELVRPSILATWSLDDEHRIHRGIGICPRILHNPKIIAPHKYVHCQCAEREVQSGEEEGDEE